MLHGDATRKPFVWSGIALSIPSDWDTGHLDSGYALLERHLRPVLEFKTATIRGRFSLQRQMKRLRGGSRPAVHPTPLPDDWPSFPERASVQAFRWQEATIGGRGLLHFCGECRRATLLRFYADGNGLSAEVPSVLASFRDHGLNSGPSLAVYDIVATLPGRLPLSAFQFDAGRFTIDFGRRVGERVTLWRLSPAKLLLKRHANDLAAIARFNGLLPSNGLAAADPAMEDGLQWRWRPPGVSRRLRAFCRGRRAPADSMLRIWHPRRTNRLLAVRAEGLRGDGDFERICEAYGVL